MTEGSTFLTQSVRSQECPYICSPSQVYLVLQSDGQIWTVVVVAIVVDVVNVVIVAGGAVVVIVTAIEGDADGGDEGNELDETDGSGDSDEVDVGVSLEVENPNGSLPKPPPNFPTISGIGTVVICQPPGNENGTNVWGIWVTGGGAADGLELFIGSS